MDVDCGCNDSWGDGGGFGVGLVLVPLRVVVTSSPRSELAHGTWKSAKAY